MLRKDDPARGSRRLAQVRDHRRAMVAALPRSAIYVFLRTLLRRPQLRSLLREYCPAALEPPCAV